MLENKYAPEVVIRRLPKYYTQLLDLDAEGIEKISSIQLSKRMGLTASQIRQDLNYFGEFGQQGYGYLVEELRKTIEEILGLHQKKKIAIVGCGHVGTALAKYKGFAKSGFYVMALFDNNPMLIGTEIGNVDIQDISWLESYLEEHHIDIGVICTPKRVAQEVATIMDEAGIKGIWNFAPTDLTVKNAVLEDVRLSDSLFVLNYKTEHDMFG